MHASETERRAQSGIYSTFDDPLGAECGEMTFDDER